MSENLNDYRAAEHYLIGEHLIDQSASEQLKSILEISLLPAWLKSLDHRFIAVNGCGALMLGAPSCELVNESVRVVYSAATVEQDHIADVHAIDGGRAGFQIDWIAAKNYWCQRTKIPISSGCANVFGIMGVARIVRTLDDFIAAILVMPLGLNHLDSFNPHNPEMRQLLGIAQAQRTPRWLEILLSNLDPNDWSTHTVEDFADAACLNLDYFTRAFKGHFGVSPALYRKRLQISLATRLLISGADQISAIAAECRFADQSHMTRNFHALLGMTPLQLRSRLRGLATH